jgi:hypothetical protein
MTRLAIAAGRIALLITAPMWMPLALLAIAVGEGLLCHDN